MTFYNINNISMHQLTWSHFLSEEKKLPYFQKILTIISNRMNQGITIYPKKKDIFNAFQYTPLKSIKAVIIGQDPYFSPKQAHGLAFSVLPGIPIPPSLKNIYTELSSDVSNFAIPNHGYLKSWTQEGVLLLNSILTVEKGKKCSHANIGWETFTDKIIQIINIHLQKIIFLLWGKYAKNKGNIINHKKHYVLEAPHPSPISASQGFFGCRHFSKTNRLLLQHNKSIINWQPKL